MKVGLFGGSFNPIHNGHLSIAKELVERKVVDEVWFVPCGNHAFGKKLVSGKDRLKMIELAINKIPKIKVVSVEMNPDKVSYTSQTVKWFKENFDYDFSFIIGSDNLKEIAKWHGFEYLKKNIGFIVVKRPEYNLENKNELKVDYLLDIQDNTSSTNVRKNIKEKSSFESLVPEEAKKYIIEEGIYNEN